MIILIDNFDSFTYNVVHALGILGAEVKVYRNNAIDTDQVLQLQPNAIVISPGPGSPERAGISVELIKKAAGKVPVLGVCLGHQALGAAFGAHICRAKHILHGKTSKISHSGKGLYQGLQNPFTAGRYHSLALDEKTLPKELIIEARSEDGEIMGIAHTKYAVYGVQFHPESILTPAGNRLIGNFLKLAEKHKGK
jgi:anthranilate synthase component II